MNPFCQRRLGVRRQFLMFVTRDRLPKLHFGLRERDQPLNGTTRVPPRSGSGVTTCTCAVWWRLRNDSSDIA